MIINNTIAEPGNSLISTQIQQLCKRAYLIETNVYQANPKTFGEKAFNQAFLGQNKLNHQPQHYPRLPYDPDDIMMFNNSIFVFSRHNKDIGYFSVLCIGHKENNKFSNIHFRFMAGIEPAWRGAGFFYLPVLENIFNILSMFKKQFPDENPYVNITQFAMVSAGTPGVIYNLTKFLEQNFQLPDFKFGDVVATNLGVMMGLGALIDQKTGIADIGLPVKIKTFKSELNKKILIDYEKIKMKEGSGISGRQEMPDLKTLLKIKPLFLKDMISFSRAKAAQFILNEHH